MYVEYYNHFKNSDFCEDFIIIHMIRSIENKIKDL